MGAAPGGAGPAADARDRLLDTLLDASQYGLLLLDERLHVVWVSDAGAASLRYTPEQMLGRRAGDFLDPSQSPGVLEAISEVLAASTPEAPGWQLGVRVRLVCGDGRTREYEFGGRPLTSNPSELMLLFSEVTERARLEDVLTAITGHDLGLALQRFLTLASSQLRAEVGIALHPSLGGSTLVTPGASPALLDDLSEDRSDAIVRAITSPIGTLFGWFVVDRDDLSAWGVETTNRLVALLGVILSNQARFSDLVTAAATDHLTGLSNRRVLEVSLVGAEASAGQGWALLYCDLDRFKSVNDEWGHDIGDLVLRVVGERLRQVTRGTDVIARLGGDEFVILAHADPEQAAQLADRVRAAVVEPITGDGWSFELGVSVGVATAATVEAVRSLLADADAAMRAEKAAGRAPR